MKLYELLDSKHKWEPLSKAHPTHYITKFLIDDDPGDEVEVNISKWRGMWDVEFSRNGTHGMSGQGAALSILGTVLDILKEFIDLENPKYITFSAKEDEDSRVKVYKRLAKKIAAMGFTDITESGDFSAHGDEIARHMTNKGSKHFLLIKK